MIRILGLLLCSQAALAAPPATIDFTVGPAWAGAPVHFEAHNLKPFADVAIVASVGTTNRPTCPPILRGTCLDISGRPTILTRVKANASGSVLITLQPQLQTGDTEFQLISHFQGSIQLSDVEFVRVMDPHVEDQDQDGLTDFEEITRWQTDPFLEDSDRDGVWDIDEVHYGSDPWNRDTDADGIIDGDERIVGTDPLSADTDGDGVSDLDELRASTNPRDATSF